MKVHQKSLFLIEEEGRINLRGRYMSSNTEVESMMVYIDLLLIKIYKYSTFKETFSEKLLWKKVYIYVVKYENL